MTLVDSVLVVVASAVLLVLVLLLTFEAGAARAKLEILDELRRRRRP